MDADKMQKFVDNMRAAGQPDDMIAQSLIDAGNNKLAVFNLLGVSSLDELSEGKLNVETVAPAAPAQPIVDEHGNLAYTHSDHPETTSASGAADLNADSPKEKNVIHPGGAGHSVARPPIHPVSRPTRSGPRSAPLHAPARPQPTPTHQQPTTPEPTGSQPHRQVTIAPPVHTEVSEPSATEQGQPVVTKPDTRSPETSSQPKLIASRSPISAESVHSYVDSSQIIERPLRPEAQSGSVISTANDDGDRADTDNHSSYEETMQLLAEHEELEEEYADHPETMEPELGLAPEPELEPEAKHTLPEPILDKQIDTSKPVEAESVDTPTASAVSAEPIKRLEPIKPPKKPTPKPHPDDTPLPQEIEVTELEAIDGTHHLKHVAEEAVEEADKVDEEVAMAKAKAIPDRPDIEKAGDAAKHLQQSAGLKAALIIALVIIIIGLAASVGYRVYKTGI